MKEDHQTKLSSFGSHHGVAPEQDRDVTLEPTAAEMASSIANLNQGHSRSNQPNNSTQKEDVNFMPEESLPQIG